MITFIIGILILVLGYVFYSKYVERQFSPDNRETPAITKNDGLDFVPLSKNRNMLIQLLNIAGMGPILGGIQGILFGPVAFLLIPLGCIFMGSVHDFFAGMISVRNDGAQVTDLVKKYLGNKIFTVFTIVVSLMLLLAATVFVYTSGDVIAERFFNQSDFSIANPTILCIYGVIALYFIIATLFPIDKIIGKLYPAFTIILLTGTALVLVGFYIKGINLQEFDIHHINQNIDGYHLLPMFFMTVSCGLLSGFHATQSTLISRTIKSEYDGKKIFYGMMCVESFIAMVWAAAAMGVYSSNLVPANLIGTVNVINIITDAFVNPYLAFIVTLAVVVLPITSGDTALRASRLVIADFFHINQKPITNRLKLMIPITIFLLGILFWAKYNSGSFMLIWRYFNFVNQLIAIPTFLYATIFLYQNKKNYFITLLPGLFYIFITTFFILNAKIGFNLSYSVAQLLGILITVVCLILFVRKLMTKVN